MNTKNKASVHPAPPLRSDLQQLHRKQQSQRDFKRHVLNSTPIAEGTRYIEFDSCHISFGFTDLKVWVPQYQKWFACDDKIINVEGRDLSVASTEFFARWNIYTKKRFNLSYIKINS